MAMLRWIRVWIVSAGSLASTVLGGTAWAADAPPVDRLEDVIVEAERYVLPRDGMVSTPTRTWVSDLILPRSTSTVSAADVLEQGARTVPQALDFEPGVFVQQTNLGGGSPIVRGLTGEQVLLLMDGIRLNNATTRSGPTQYLNLVDPHLIERIEVLRGPGSVLYGSDALGGVVHLVPRRRAHLTRDLCGDLTLLGNLSTATDGGTVAARYEGSWRGLGFVGGTQFHRFEDQRIGDGKREDHTGYEGLASDLRLELAPAACQRLAFGYQFHEDRDVPRTDALASGANLAFDFDPQRRQLIYLDGRGSSPGAFLESWRVNVSGQRWDEGRFEVRSASPTRERRLYDRVDTLGAFGHLSFRPHPHHRLTAGFELYHDEVYSRRRDTNTTTGVTTSATSRYPTGSTWTPLGVYVQDEWTPSPCWFVVAGLRYSRYDLHTGDRPETNPPVEEANATTDAWTGSLGLSVEVAPGWRVFGSVAQGFRAPNVDDTTVFDRAATGIEVPNPELDPETVLSYEAGCKTEVGCVRAGLSGWYARFSDLIQRVPTGDVIDALPVSTRRNVADADMVGGEAWADVDLRGGWRAFGSISYVRGTDLASDQPLNKIPPLHGVVGARWTRGDGRRFVEPYARWAGRQVRLSAADVADFRIGPNGTPGWITANVRVGFELDEGRSFVIEAGNLLDERYKHHGSGVEGPGRHLTLSFSLTF